MVHATTTLKIADEGRQIVEQIDAIREERSLIPIAVFVNGFAAGWKMAVPGAFKDALDIKLTQRIVGGKKQMVWTQGRVFDFKEGDTIHDVHTPFAVWREALEQLTLMVQVLQALPSAYVNPGGHLKLPHPWPGQIPPSEAAGRMDGYTLSARFATRAAALRSRQLLPSNFSRCAWCISRSSSGVTMTTSPSSVAQSSTGRLDVMIVERFS